MIKEEITWYSVDEKMPFDDLIEKMGHLGWTKECIVDDVLVQIEPEEPIDGTTIMMCEYSGRDGWCFLDGTPAFWADKVSHWANMPKGVVSEE